jgi:hypothetical protein
MIFFLSFGTLLTTLRDSRCGLRYARSRAKKEGHGLTSQRRRKDKGLGVTKRESATPPVSASPSYSPARRGGSSGGGYDNSFSTGSNSGSEVYSQSGHHALDTLTPSPSPPASSVNFVHYSPHSQSSHHHHRHHHHHHHGSNSESSSTTTRQPYSTSAGTFYSVPSPLSNSPVIHASHHGSHVEQQQQQQQQHHYSDRMSSPISHSPLMTSTTAPASFERERDKDRELPPTPVSAEPRQHSRRAVLAHDRS